MENYVIIIFKMLLLTSEFCHASEIKKNKVRQRMSGGFKENIDYNRCLEKPEWNRQFERPRR